MMYPRSVRMIFAALMIFSIGFPVQGQQLHDVHRNAGVVCAACHKETPAAVAPPNATCVACHGTMLVPKPGARLLSPDPHRSPHLAADEVPACNDCHKIHKASEVTCVTCHRSFQFNTK